MIQIDVLDDGTEVLVSDERFKTLSLTVDGEEQPTRFAVVLTDEMKDAIIQGWYS